MKLGEFFRYRAYGLTLQANRPLPGLFAASANAPVDVWVDLMGERESQTPSAAETISSLSPNRDRPVEYRSGLNALSKTNVSYFHLWFRGFGQIDFEIDSQGSHISATWTYSLLEEVAGLLLGPALGCTLRLRGTVCLHACVVGIGQRAIAIVGEKGAGKSTTAAALATRKHSILSDDIAVLNSDGQHFLVQPGYPRLRLWPEAINTLYGSEVPLMRVLSSSEKRYLNLTDNSETAWRFQSDTLPLAAIYVLGERVPSLAAPAIEPIPPAIGVMALMAHRSASFLTLEREKQAREFAVLSRVAATVPVRKVSRPDSLDALPQLCDAILEDLAGIATPEKCAL